MPTLELRRDDGGWRHYIADAAIHSGDTIQVRFPGATWVRGRYEWSFNPKELPRVYFALPGCDEPAMMVLPPGADLRPVR